MPDGRQTTNLRASAAPRPAPRPERPSYRRISPAVFSVLIEIGQQLFQCVSRYRLTGRRFAAVIRSGGDPTLADSARQDGVVLVAVRNLSRRVDLCNWAAAVGDNHRLAGLRGMNAFAELALQGFQADGAHGSEVSSRGPFVNLSSQYAARRLFGRRHQPLRE